MNVVKMPGFTAGASLSKTRGHYWFAAGVIIKSGLVPQLNDSDIPGATCGKDRIFGNVICVQCTAGKCKTYVCDKNGNNCKQTSPLIRPLLIGSTAGTANLFRAD